MSWRRKWRPVPTPAPQTIVLTLQSDRSSRLAPTSSELRYLAVVLTCSVKNRHNERPGDLLPPRRDTADPESDDEKVRAMLRRVEAENMVASSGDVVEGELQTLAREPGLRSAHLARAIVDVCRSSRGRATQAMQG